MHWRFPHTVDEYVPQEHPVRFVVDLVESAALRDFELTCSDRGSAAMMLALLLYGYIEKAQTHPFPEWTERRDSNSTPPSTKNVRARKWVHNADNSCWNTL